MLKDILCAPATRPLVVRDAAKLVDNEVHQKSGFGGLAVKAAYTVVTKLKPGLIVEVVDSLLNDFVDRLEPYFAEWRAAGNPGGFDTYLGARKDRVANSLLTVTDDRAKVVDNATMRKAYESLRPHGQKHVEVAVPGLAALMSSYLSRA